MFHDTSMSAGFYNANQSQTSPSKDKGRNRMHNVLPVCVRQILSCAGDEFSLFGMRAQIVSIVGILRDYDVSTIKATYTIEDHTGQIKALLWLETDSNDQVNLPPVKEGRYLKLFGSLRMTDNEKTLLVLKMIPVDDPNMITTHLLEVMQARYAAQMMQNEGNMTKIANNPSAALANTMGHMYEDPNSSNLTPIQLKVNNILKSEPSMSGMHISALLSNFQPNQHGDVHAAIAYLQTEGHIYSTIDPNHFKSTD